MTAARLILLLLLILVAVVLVVLVLRRGSAQRDAQRVEAAGLRTEAETLATTVAGQSAFAEQAAQRAELARVEAEDKAREAARLEAEAAQHQAAVEATRRDYEATMRRADDIDPDVKESTFPAVADEGAGDGDDEGARDGVDEEADRSADRDAGQGEPLMTRAERRAAREAGETGVTGEAGVASETGAASEVGHVGELSMVGEAGDADDVEDGDGDETGETGSGAGWAAPSAASSVPAAGAAGAAAAGASAWADRGEASPQSERIASAADFRDDVAADPTDVYPADHTGTEPGMSNDARTETTEHAAHDDGPETGGAAAAAGAGAGGAYAATRALHDDTPDDTAEGADATDVPVGTGTTHATDATDTPAEQPGDDLSRDVESPSGDWGGPPQGEPAEMTIVEPEAYAATEPVLASDQTPPVTPEQVGTDHEGTGAPAPGELSAAEGDHSDDADEAVSDEHAPAEAGAAVAAAQDTDRSAADRAEESTQERYDPTPTRDWAADEGELLEQTHDRGDRLEAERTELAQESDDAAGTTASDTVGEDATAGDHGTETTATHDSSEAAQGTERQGRRISGFDELRDGGFGVGSAAPLDDGAQPLDHPVAAYRDTMTYRVPGDAGYDSAEPHVWFYDEGAAERSGFRRSEG